MTVFGHKQGDAFKKIKIINTQVTEGIEKISYIQVSDMVKLHSRNSGYKKESESDFDLSYIMALVNSNIETR